MFVELHFHVANVDFPMGKSSAVFPIGFYVLKRVLKKRATVAKPTKLLPSGLFFDLLPM